MNLYYVAGVPADVESYVGIPYADLTFGEVDWAEAGTHDPGRRSKRKERAEQDVHAEWATEACQDPRRWVRSSESRSGLTVKVTGWSPSTGFLVTVILAPKDHPSEERWWGATAWKAKSSEVRDYREG